MRQKTVFIQKNFLDLNYNKYLQYLNTTIIIMFTYAIGMVLAFLTRQIDYQNPKQIGWIMIINSAFFVVTIMLVLNFKDNLDETVNKIQKLK